MNFALKGKKILPDLPLVHFRLLPGQNPPPFEISICKNVSPLPGGIGLFPLLISIKGNATKCDDYRICDSSFAIAVGEEKENRSLQPRLLPKLL
jgi:hypothetical protein